MDTKRQEYEETRGCRGNSLTKVKGNYAVNLENSKQSGLIGRGPRKLAL